MVVMSLFGLFLGAVQEAAVVALRSTHSANQRENIRLQLARAMDRLTREATMTGVGATDITTATATQFQFNADLDGNGTVETTGIRYWQNASGDLERSQVSPSAPAVTLVEDLTSVVFSYVNADGSTYTSGSTANIRLVQVTLTAARDAETFSVAGAIYLRNR